MTMQRTLRRTQRRLPGQQQAITPALAFGLVDPPCEPLDPGFVTDRRQLVPVEHDIGAQRLLVFAHQQGIATRRWFPRDRAARIATAVGAQVVDIVASRMQPGLCLFTGSARQRRAVRLGRGIHQQRRVRPHVGPGPGQAQRAGGGDAQPVQIQPAAMHRGQHQYCLADTVIQ